MLEIASIKTKALNPKKSQFKNWSKGYIISAGMLLLFTGCVKIVSALGKIPVLEKPDPIFGITFHHLLLGVGLIELVVAVICFTLASQSVALGILAVLSTNFLIYHAGLWTIHWDGYCPCLGNLTEAIGLSHRLANFLNKLMLGYLFWGSLLFLICLCWEGRSQSSEVS